MAVKFKIPLTPGYLRSNLADGQSDTINIRLVAYLPQSKIGQSWQGSLGQLGSSPSLPAMLHQYGATWCYTLHIGMQHPSQVWTKHLASLQPETNREFEHLQFRQVNVLN